MAVRWLLLAAVALAFLAGCASGGGSGDQGTRDSTEAPTLDEPDVQRYPDVIDVTVERSGDTFTFAVTISSPYDTPERYADGWRIVGMDGTVYGEHTLAHDHADEQPFTRTQTGVGIPATVREVTVEGRDTEHGYGGDTVTVPLP